MARADNPSSIAVREVAASTTLSKRKASGLEDKPAVKRVCSDDESEPPPGPVTQCRAPAVSTGHLFAHEAVRRGPVGGFVPLGMIVTMMKWTSLEVLLRKLIDEQDFVSAPTCKNKSLRPDGPKSTD